MLFLFIHFIFFASLSHFHHPSCTANNFLLFLFFNNFLCCFSQTIIPNLTSYSIYIVSVQAASLSTYKPHRMLLGSHSPSRKVNLMFLFSSFVPCPGLLWSGRENSCEFSVSCKRGALFRVLLRILLDSAAAEREQKKANKWNWYEMETINSTEQSGFVYFCAIQLFSLSAAVTSLTRRRVYFGF